ncbi:MAG: hypothetical protein SGI77_21355 [Pirellulaceae bacterium]|nr:hypothetical protein [Pirellulaceae bacterium]
MRILNLAIVIAAIVPTSSKLFGQPIDEKYAHAYSLMKGILESQASVRTFDVRVDKWSSLTVQDAANAEKAPPIETTISYRLIADLNKHRIFIVRRITIESNQSKRFPQFSKADTRLASFNDGQAIRRMLHHSGDIDRPQQVDFEMFCRKDQIELPHYVGIFGPLRIWLTKPIEELSNRLLAAYNECVVQTAPDGTMRIINDGEKGRTVYVVDPISLTVTQRIVTREENGVSKTLLVHDVKYLEESGVYLPVEVSFSGEEQLPDVTSTFANGIPADEVGTIDIEWLSVNDPEMTFAELDELKVDVKKWDEFLKPINKDSKNRTQQLK